MLPWTVVYQAPLSMGLFRQEYWSELPCPPPEDLLDPGIKPRSPTFQADSLPSESPGKLKNTGVGSLSPLQGIFWAQELDWGLLHCRWILYQLSYQGFSRQEYWSGVPLPSPKSFANLPLKFLSASGHLLVTSNYLGSSESFLS